MALPDAYRAITLLDFNVGAAAAVGLLNPMGAQLDALIGIALGPFTALLAAQFNAALAAQASLSLNISLGPMAAMAQLQAAVRALAQLIATFTAALALGFPPIQFSANANLSASLALAATLQAQLGGLKLLIQAALAVKIPAIKAAAGFAAALAVGPFFAISFSGTTVRSVSNWLAGEVASGQLYSTTDHVSLPVDQPDVYGVLIFGGNPSFRSQFGAIISVP